MTPFEDSGRATQGHRTIAVEVLCCSRGAATDGSQEPGVERSGTPGILASTIAAAPEGRPGSRVAPPGLLLSLRHSYQGFRCASTLATIDRRSAANNDSSAATHH